jgi:hypothetical protein
MHFNRHFQLFKTIRILSLEFTFRECFSFKISIKLILSKGNNIPSVTQKTFRDNN